MKIKNIKKESLCDEDLFDYYAIEAINESKQVKPDSVQIIINLARHVFELCENKKGIVAHRGNGGFKLTSPDKKDHQYILTPGKWLEELMDIIPTCFVDGFRKNQTLEKH